MKTMSPNCPLIHSESLMQRIINALSLILKLLKRQAFKLISAFKYDFEMKYAFYEICS